MLVVVVMVMPAVRTSQSPACTRATSVRQMRGTAAVPPGVPVGVLVRDTLSGSPSPLGVAVVVDVIAIVYAACDKRPRRIVRREGRVNRVAGYTERVSQ